MKTTVERELKLEADGSLSIDELGGELIEPRAFTSTYYDTGDGLLLRLGIQLRRRLEDGENTWQLKLPREDARVELEVDGVPGDLPSELAEVLRATLDGRHLRPVATLRTRRSGRRVDGAEVTLDAVEVLDGQRVASRFTEIEAELVAEDPRQLSVLERRLRKAGARVTDGRSKLSRVLDPAEPEQPGPRASAVVQLRALLRTQHEQLLGHDPGVRVGGEPEDVHAMRVAVRRSRAVLRAARPILDPDWGEGLRKELEWLGDQLAPVRDLDVLSAYLEGELASLPSIDAASGRRLLDLLEEDHENARGALLEALDTDRYLRLLSALDAAATAPRVRTADIGAAELARSEFRRLRKFRRRLGSDLSDGELHELRIRGKRARYAAELAASARGGAAKRFIVRAEEFQDVVGEHQDAIVAERVVRDLSARARSPGASLAAGRIVERQEERRRRAREAYPEAWKRLRRAGERAWHE
jgi:CHAD domain-containing protein